MGFGTKGAQEYSTNLQAIRAVKGVCGSTGNISCSTTTLIGSSSSDTINIYIQKISNITYNSTNNKLSFTMKYNFTNSYTLPNPTIPISLSLASSQQPLGYSSITESSTSVTTATLTATVNVTNWYSTPTSGTYNVVLNTNLINHSGPSYSSNNYKFSFTVN